MGSSCARRSSNGDLRNGCIYRLKANGAPLRVKGAPPDAQWRAIWRQNGDGDTRWAFERYHSLPCRWLPWVHRSYVNYTHSKPHGFILIGTSSLPTKFSIEHTEEGFHLVVNSRLALLSSIADSAHILGEKGKRAYFSFQRV